MVSLGITGVVLLLTAFSAIAIVRRGPEDQKSSQAAIPTQDVSLGEENGAVPTELQGSEESLLVNGDIITRGVLKVKSNNFVSILGSVPLTANQTINLPNASGTICLDANNCNFATSAQLNQTQAQVNQLSQIIPQPFDGVTALNGQNGSVSIQGSVNRIAVSTSNGVVTLATPQDLDANANVQFNSLTVNTAGEIKSNILRQTAAGSDITIDAFNDDVILISGGRTFLLPAGGGGTQTICTTQGNCGGGGATPVILAPGSAQAEATADASIFINDTGGGNLIQLQSSGIDRLVVTPAGDTAIGGTLTVAGLGSGVVRATGGLLSTGAVNLPTEVAGTLAVANGGTGAASLTANGVLIGNGTGAITSVVSGGTGLCFMSNAGAPSWQACPGGGGVTTLNAMTGAITVQGTANQINVASGAGLITLSTPQDIATTSNVQFNNLNLSGQADIAGHMALGNGAAVSTTAALNIVETFAAACPFNCTAIDAHTTGQAASNQMTSLVTGVTMDNAGALSAAGIHVASNSVLGTGVIVDNYGIFIAAQTAGTNDYGIYVQAADTYAFWADAGLSRFDGGVEIQGGSPIILEGATDNAFETTLAVSDPSADNTITLPNASGVVCLDSGNCIGSGGGAPNSATYLLATNDPTLTNDRALAAGSNIAFTDAGANSSFTVATVQNPTFTTSVTTPILQSAGALTITSSGAGNDITLTSADQVIVNGITDINSYAAIGNNAGAQSISALSLGHAFDSGVNCAAFGCYGLLATVDANNAGGVNPGITGLYSNVSVSAGSLLQSAGVFVATTSGAGTVTDNYGMYIANQTKGTNDYGLYIQGADTYALWVDSGTSRFDGNLEFEGATDDAFEFTLTVADPTADRTYTIPNSSAATDTFCLVTLGNCAGSGGGVTGSGTNNRVAKFTSTGSTIGDSTISDDGTNVSITGDFTIQGGGLTAGSIAQVGSLLLHDGDGETLTLTLPDVSGSYSLLFPASVGAANQCLKAQDGSGTLFWEDCLGGGGGGGITSLDGQTGPAITINNATGAANVITIDNAAADGTTKGIAAFNATNFSSASGVVNTIQGISTAATPQFAGLTLTGNLQVDGNTTLGNAAGDVLTINGTAIATPNDLNFDSNTFFIDESANAVALGTTSTSSAFRNNILTVQSSATKDEIYILGDDEFNLAAEGSSYLSFDRDDDFASAEFAVLTGNTGGAGVSQLFTIDKSGDITSVGNATFEGGLVSVGSSGQAGSLALYDGGVGVAAHTGTLQAVGTLGQNTSYILQDPGVASVDICLSSGNCAGSNSFTTINTANGTDPVADNSTDTLNLVDGTNITVTGDSTTDSITIATINNPTFSTSVTTPLLTNAGQLAVTATGGGNDITFTSADQIFLTSAGTIELQNSTNLTGNLVGTGTGAFQGATVSIGADSQQGSLVLRDGGTGGALHSGTLQVINTLGQNTTYTLIDPGLANVNICLSTGNCAGAGSGVTTSGGTTNRIAMFNGTQSVANSWLLQNGSTLELDTTRNLSVTGGNLSVLGNTELTAATDSVSMFNIRTQTTNNLFTVDTIGSAVGINLGTTVTPAIDNGLEVQGGIRITGGTNMLDNYLSPEGVGFGTRINIPNSAIAAGNTGIALGILENGGGNNNNAMAITVFDQRTMLTGLRPAIGLFSQNEDDILGFSWEGQSTTGYVKTMTGNVGIRSGTTDIATFAPAAITLLQNTTAAGTVSVNGNTIFGDAANDTVTFNGVAVAAPNNLNFDSNTLFVDSTNDRIGMGTASPTNMLSVSPLYYNTGTASTSGTTTVTGVGTTWTAAMVGKEFIFANGNKYTITAFTSSTQMTLSASSTNTSQTYYIQSAGLQVASTSGDVGIGVATPLATLHVGSGRIRAEGGILELRGGAVSGLINESQNNGFIYSDTTGNMIIQPRAGTAARDLFLTTGNNTSCASDAINCLQTRLEVEADGDILFDAGNFQFSNEYNSLGLQAVANSANMFTIGSSSTQVEIATTGSNDFDIQSNNHLIVKVDADNNSTGDREFIVQNGSGANILMVNESAQVFVGSSALQGSLAINDGDGETVTITIDDVTSNATIKIPDAVGANDTFCLVTLSNCGSNWTDTGTLLHPADLSGAEDIAIGGTSVGTADIFLGATGSAVFNEQGNDADFRIESDALVNAFFLDASTNNIGVNTNTPGWQLHLKGDGAGNDGISIEASGNTSDYIHSYIGGSDNGRIDFGDDDFQVGHDAETYDASGTVYGSKGITLKVGNNGNAGGIFFRMDNVAGNAGTDDALLGGFDNNGDFFIEQSLNLGVQSFTPAGAATLTPTSAYVEGDCSNGAGCAVTMSETGAVEGDVLFIVNVGANALTFSDTTGVSELSAAHSLGQYDSLSLIYTGDRWVQTAFADN